MNQAAATPETDFAARLPNFLVIGAQKAGTTWLAGCLGEHPDVFVSPEKELYFFNREFERGLAWYARRFEAAGTRKARGEATPGYLSHPEAARRIRDTLGDVRLIASLRQPVDRAYSAFWHHLRKGRIPVSHSFLDALQSDLYEIHSRGLYAPQLRRFLDCFPRERLQVLLFEEMFGDPDEALRCCFAFLEVDAAQRVDQKTRVANAGGRDLATSTAGANRVRALIPPALRRTLLQSDAGRAVVRAGRRLYETIAFERGATLREFEPLDPGLRARLTREHFAADIDETSQLLGRDLSAWLVEAPGTANEAEPPR